jgi:hypothetical protein
VFAVCSTGTRPLGQAIFGTWTRHSTPGHMPNLRAAGRLMPVAQASDGVPLCLLGKRSRIALNPEPRQFLRFFDFEAETIETRSLRHGAGSPSATVAARIGEARLRTWYPAACCRLPGQARSHGATLTSGVTTTLARASNRPSVMTSRVPRGQLPFSKRDPLARPPAAQLLGHSGLPLS